MIFTPMALWGRDDISTGQMLALINAAPDLLAAALAFRDYEREMDDRDDVSGLLLYAKASELLHKAIAKAGQ